MTHLEMLFKARSISRISELRKAIGNLDREIAEAQGSEPPISEPEWLAEGPGQGLRCDVDAQDCSIVALWTLFASLAEFSETEAPIEYVVVS